MCLSKRWFRKTRFRIFAVGPLYAILSPRWSLSRLLEYNGELQQEEWASRPAGDCILVRGVCGEVCQLGWPRLSDPRAQHQCLQHPHPVKSFPFSYPRPLSSCWHMYR